MDEGPIGIQQWKNFGIAIADALKEYVQICRNGDAEEMAEYLKDTINNDMIKWKKKFDKNQEIFPKVEFRKEQ